MNDKHDAKQHPEPPLQAEHMNETYLGDAVYASFDGYHIWLRTTNGIQTLDRIALEPPVYANLLQYAQLMYSRREQDAKGVEDKDE